MKNTEGKLRRHCRDCDKPLPKSRYFKCVQCQSLYEDVSDEFIYEDPSFDNFDDIVFDDVMDEDEPSL